MALLESSPRPATTAQASSSGAAVASDSAIPAQKAARPSERIGTARPLVEPLGAAKGRRVAILAVHHVRADGYTYTGGAEKYLLSVVQALLDAGAEVHVGYSGDSIYEELLDRYEPRRLTVERTGWIDAAIAGDARLTLGAIQSRRRWFRAVGADTVFAVQQAGGGAFGASILAAWSMGRRVVASIRQLPPALPPPGGKRLLGILPSPELWRRRPIWRRRIVDRCCDVLIFNSRRVAEAHRRQFGFPEAKLCVIPNGELVGRPRVRRITRDCRFVIVTAGRITEAKGADVLLEAFVRLLRHQPHCRLAYYGDGPLSPALQARVRAEGLSDCVAFRCYEPDRDAIFRDAHLYVQASRRESMSNSVIEALARGIPCVVSDVGGQAEAVADGACGYVVPVDDPGSLAGAMARILSDRRVHERFSDAAQRRAAQVFNLPELMRRTVLAILGQAEPARPRGR